MNLFVVVAYAEDLSDGSLWSKHFENEEAGPQKQPVVPIGEADLAPPGPTLTLTKHALRACLVRVRVGMVLYAISYEKDISN